LMPSERTRSVTLCSHGRTWADTGRSAAWVHASSATLIIVPREAAVTTTAPRPYHTAPAATVASEARNVYGLGAPPLVCTSSDVHTTSLASIGRTTRRGPQPRRSSTPNRTELANVAAITDDCSHTAARAGCSPCASNHTESPSTTLTTSVCNSSRRLTRR